MTLNDNSEGLKLSHCHNQYTFKEGVEKGFT